MLQFYEDTANELNIFAGTEKFVIEGKAWELLCWVVCLPTVVGNILILISIIRFSGVRSSSNTLIGNLSISDLLVGAILIVPFLNHHISC